MRAKSEAVELTKRKGLSPLQSIIEVAANSGQAVSLSKVSSQVQRDKNKSGETLRNEDLAQHCADLGAAGAEDGVGVVLSHAGVVPSGRPGVIIAIAESQEMLSHFVTTTEHTKPHSLHVFMDGKWDFGHISRDLQAFMATLVGPVTLKGYSFAITLMDVKSAEDYRTGLEPIINMLKKAFTAAGLDMAEHLQVHKDGEEAVYKALEQLCCESKLQIVECNFHVHQNIHKHGLRSLATTRASSAQCATTCSESVTACTTTGATGAQVPKLPR